MDCRVRPSSRLECIRKHAKENIQWLIPSLMSHAISHDRIRVWIRRVDASMSRGHGSQCSHPLSVAVHCQASHRAESGEDAGFTLIELMVVLLILAILLAIAIPTFLGVTKSANDRAAQSNLNTALLNAKAQYQQNSQAYPTTANLVAALSRPSRPCSSYRCVHRPEPHLRVRLGGRQGAGPGCLFGPDPQLLDHRGHPGGDCCGHSVRRCGRPDPGVPSRRRPVSPSWTPPSAPPTGRSRATA